MSVLQSHCQESLWHRVPRDAPSYVDLEAYMYQQSDDFLVNGTGHRRQVATIVSVCLGAVALGRVVIDVCYFSYSTLHGKNVEHLLLMREYKFVPEHNLVFQEKRDMCCIKDHGRRKVEVSLKKAMLVAYDVMV